MSQARRLVVGITGASGSIYAARFMRALADCYDGEIHLILSTVGEQVLAYECSPEHQRWIYDYPRLLTHKPGNMWAGPSSGSFEAEGMVVIPCSMGHVGQIAAGISADLIGRAADVMLKEQRPLILVPRETPFNKIHLRNLLTLAEAGATIVPAAPGFYHHPESIDDLADTIVARVLDLLRLPHQIGRRWRDVPPQE
ncbi:MAG: putative UbiX-like flavin prenyltransferase [bacterium]|nr:putative UbiX-like flavin prenyltransferase [bacterium]